MLIWIFGLLELQILEISLIELSIAQDFLLSYQTCLTVNQALILDTKSTLSMSISLIVYFLFLLCGTHPRYNTRIEVLFRIFPLDL
jgi:hypothetical protein